MELTGLRQNLLSHHLAIMTACHLISMRRSIGDARRHYYIANLETAQSLHDWWCEHSPLGSGSPPATESPRRVLFLCLSNASRSLLAESLTRHLAPGVLEPYSAGLVEGRQTLVELSRRALAERAFPTAGLEVKTWQTFAGQSFDYLITVCDHVHEAALPPQLAARTFLHWSLPDPTTEASDEAGQLAALHALIDELRLRIKFFVQRLASAP